MIILTYVMDIKKERQKEKEMNIIHRIEELRLELNALGAEKGLKDPQVIKLSQRLDKLINEYYKLTQR